MQPLLIRTTGPMPPGGYAFRDAKTGKHYVDMHTNFRDRVKQIIRDRMANPIVYPRSEMEPLMEDTVGLELSEYNCRRLNNDPRFCDGNVSANASNVKVDVANPVTTGKACPTCGGTLWEAIFCKSCGGKKLKGYQCVGCGKRIPK